MQRRRRFTWYLRDRNLDGHNLPTQPILANLPSHLHTCPNLHSLPVLNHDQYGLSRCTIPLVASSDMVKKTAVPDAWDDDWESQADKLAAGDSNNNNNNKTEPEPEPEMPQTKAERLARHAETNRKLWESA